MQSRPSITAEGAYRFASLDGLRGVLALLVVLFHQTVIAARIGLQSVDGPLVTLIARLIVWIFFCLSAYVLVRAWGRVSFPVFLVQRLVRLWPCMAVCIAASAFVLGNRLDPAWFSGLTIDIPPDYPAWSLVYEARAMLFMPILVWCSRGRLWRPVALVCLAYVIVGASSQPLGAAVAFVLGARLSLYKAPSISLLNSAICQFVGRISYSLYISHWAVVVFLATHFGNLSLALTIPASLLVATAVWFTVERQSIEWSRALARGLANRP
jgi:peptidoglycan/LPS O-acetylase OafA/YrhL